MTLSDAEGHSGNFKDSQIQYLVRILYVRWM